MKTERQHRQNQNKRTTVSTLNGGRSKNPSPSETSYSLEDGSLPRKQHVEGKIEEGNNIISSKPIFQQSEVEMASEINSVDILFDEPWRSPSSELASVLDVIGRRMSSESVDSDILSSAGLDFAPSLDDVFDVLDEMDSLESSLQINVPLTTPSTHLMAPQMYRANSPFQLPSGSHPWNSFEGFNFGLVKGLQNPSRGLITAMRRLCELLSKPRSDHLESVFVRLLNNALSDMEDATQPQSKRPRRNNERLAVSKRQRKRPNKSASDVDTIIKSPKIELLTHPFASKSHSLPVISTRAGRRTETIDLTGLEESEKKQQQDGKESQKEPFIALEDTMSVFMSSLSNNAAKQEN